MAIVYTDIAYAPRRVLTKQFDSVGGSKGGDKTKAVGTASPNALNSNLPNINDAMGVSPPDGVICLWHDGASQAFTLYFWSGLRNKLDASKGWIKAGESSTVNTKTIDPESNCEVKCPAGVPYFLQAGTSVITNMAVHDGGEFKGNPNTDVTVTT